MKKIFILDWGEKGTNPAYAASVAAAGGEPKLARDFCEAEGCDALLLTGGGDMAPSLFGEDNCGSRGIDPLRDRMEYDLIRRFEGKPMLGICRGHQVLNVFFGGKLIQDIPAAARHGGGAGDCFHPVIAAKDSLLSRLYGAEFTVNSSHHQALKIPGSGFEILALSDDGYIEATENRARKILSVQWHPERMRSGKTPDGTLLFRAFLDLFNE